jgi:hypothetical protein
VVGLIATLVVVGVATWRTRTPASVSVAPPPEISSGVSPGTAISPVARRETRPTLDPALFVGKAALAHRVAREIPDVLDQLYCYCYCDKHLGHKSLLSCYTDGHAAT